MKISKELKRAIHQLYYWQQGSTSFTASLYMLMQKADSNNLARLKQAFPDEFEAWSLWRLAPTQNQFFELYCSELLKKNADAEISDESEQS